MKNILTSLIFFICLSSCKRNNEICNPSLNGNFDFQIYEYVLDTILETDTAYINKDIFFKTNPAFTNTSWTIGNDPRIFTTNIVNLKFFNPENINVKLSATGINKFCSSEQFTVSKPFVLLDDNGTIKSPLIGTYQGYNSDKPSDTFTISIKFWFGLRYPWWGNGAYSVENLPKGYVDSTQNFNGFNRPEIKGIIASTGYKNIAIDKSGYFPAAGIKGYGNLRRGLADTLLFTYTIIDTLKFNQTGQLEYLKKIFKGIKK